MILSALSSVSLEDVRKSAPNCKLWMHPYVFRDRRLTEKIVKRAVKAGFSAVVLTADSPVKGGVKVEDKGISVPPPANLSAESIHTADRRSRRQSDPTSYTLHHSAPKQTNSRTHTNGSRPRRACFMYILRLVLRFRAHFGAVEMETERKRRLAAMALALYVDEEDYPAPKRSCWFKDWMCRKELGLQNQIVACGTLATVC
ncbi:hypothetical protein HPB48_016278 [Haemaphysalis longicornis]|uniref:FMN-dependent dehydrogenase domain-containing protein n=1 Tax=Haemaphysalis longicornis TaxID=44386 RepID=A0A9J6FTR7_HAELO|nr:hypothetical protein HPB48_016278 [Haemaphysalis longicornis]